MHFGEFANRQNSLPSAEFRLPPYPTRRLSMAWAMTQASSNIRLAAVIEERDLVFPPEIIREAAAQVPGSQVVEIPETGHSPYFEAPNECNQVVFQFLAAVQ